MSKRVTLSNEKAPAKRARGFRLARRNPEASVPTTSSLFVTLNADDERQGPGKLKTQSRLLSSSRTIDSSAQPSSTTPETGFEPMNETENDERDFSGPMDIDPTPPPDIAPKPKRKRYTTNVVSGWLPFDC
jgi:hypothetical protein